MALAFIPEIEVLCKQYRHHVTVTELPCSLKGQHNFFKHLFNEIDMHSIDANFDNWTIVYVCPECHVAKP